MGLTLLERYIFKKALFTLLVAAGGLIGVIWIVRAVQQVDVILNKGQGILVYLQIITLAVPTLTAAVVPMALLIALIKTINTLTHDSEMAVIHASGASRLSLAKPFLVLGLATSILVYTLHIWVGPSSMLTLRQFVTQVRADLVSVVVKEGQFQNVGHELTFHIAGRQPGGELQGVFILDTRNPKETLTYLARRGAISKVNGNSYLLLNDGEIQRQTTGAENLSIIKFDAYAFNLSSFSGAKINGFQSQMEVPTSHLLSPSSDDAFYKKFPGRYWAELHVRLTGGLYPVMVVLIVLAFMGNPSSHRQSHMLVVIATSCIIIVLRGAAIGLEGAARSNANLIFAMWGIPVVGIAAASFVLATDRTALPPSLLKAMAGFVAKVAGGWSFLTHRLRRRQAVSKERAA